MTEERLLKNLKAMTGRTVIIITHRPAALKICDNWIDATADRLNLDNKTQYLIRRVFPTMKWWNNYYPTTVKCPLLVVPFFFYRLGRMLTVRRKANIKELKYIIRTKKKEFGKK